MKRLFQIVDTRTGKRVGEYHEDKRVAKESRRSLNKTKEGVEVLRHVVSRGPDNIRY